MQQLVDHCGDYQGKRLRPALLLLAARACGSITPAHPVLAAVVEMIHTATLVHDDILDESMVRRHAATVNAEWGNETAVLLGDYLFTHAFHLAASLESTLACRWIGRATNRVCEGEMQQVHHRGNLDLDEASYFAIIEGKTAELTAVSCRLGAHYAGADEAMIEALDRYGRNLGIAFQIADDVLDIWGEERDDRQEPGHRPGEAEADAPRDPLAGNRRSRDRCQVRRMLGEAKAECRKQLIPLLEQSGTLDYSWQRRPLACQGGRRFTGVPGRVGFQGRPSRAGRLHGPASLLTGFFELWRAYSFLAFSGVESPALTHAHLPVSAGTISRHIICSGQLFAQFFRGHPEELPEAQRGQLQAQEAVRRLILSVPGPELV